MNSIGNPATVTNHYFYWRADRLRGATDGPPADSPPQLVPPSETFLPPSSGNAYEELAKLTPDVRGGVAFSAGSMMQDQLTAMAYKMTGIPNISGGRLSPADEQRLAQAQDTLMAMVQAKMDQGIPFGEAFANVYHEQGSPVTFKRAPVQEEGPEDGDGGGSGGYSCRNGMCPDYTDMGYCPVEW